jgi:hypothetical protein
MSLVILGAIEMRKRTSLDGLAVYLGSLRAQNRDVRMVMFNRSPSHVGLRALLNKHNVDIVDAVAYDRAYNFPPVEIEIARFLEYGAWLESNHFHTVLLTDVLDVAWQRDPASHRFGDGISAWQENRQVRDCRYNRKWVRECWPLSYHEMLDRPVVCCGVLAGAYQGISDYLEWYARELRSRGVDHVRRGFDSAMINAYCPTAQFPYVNPVCMHLGYAPLARVVVEGDVTVEGQTPMILHQYNRHPDTMKGLYDRWI